MSDLTVLRHPITVNQLTFPNRYVSAPLDLQTATEAGLVTEELLGLYRERKGPALVITEHHHILPSGKWNSRQLAADRDECIDGMARLAGTIHANRQIAVAQINHVGSAADTKVTGLEAVAPSAVVHPVWNRSLPRELSLPEIQEIRQAFVKAALRVKQAGFDGVEIHGAHGYLLTQFLSPLTNRRQDEYGGNLEKRSRFLLEVAAAVRRAVGPGYLLLYRLGADDYLPGGTSVEDACWLAPRLAAAGVDILDLSSGLKGSRSFSGPGFFRDMLKQVKNAVTIPVIGVGGLEDPAVAAGVLANAEADFIALGRAIMKQPDLVETILGRL